MKKVFFFLPLSIIFSCSGPKQQDGKTAMDTGRAFIRASLDGNFEEAEKHLSSDPKNAEYMSLYKEYYNKMPSEQKEQYKKATYEINNIEDLPGDSVSIINYSNSYMKKPIEIKLVREGERWGVDFKYTYNRNDSTK